MIPYIQFKKLSHIQIILIWFTIATLFFTTSLTTIEISPTRWQDEMQIIELGKLIAENQSELSLWGLLDLKINYWKVLWITPIVNFLFEVGGYSIIFPRLFSLVGAYFAALTLYLWNRSLGISNHISIFIAILLLLDPSLAQSYRGGRIDAWVFTMLFISCILITYAPIKTKKYPFFWPFISGISLGFTLFTWPSVILLIPILLITSIHAHAQFKLSRSSSLSYFLPLILFTITTMFTIIAIYYKDFYRELTGLILSSKSSFTSSHSLTILHTLKLIPSIFIHLKLSFPLLILGFTSMLFCRSIILFVATLIAMFGIAYTSPYIHRSIYLIPYVILFISHLFLEKKFPTLHQNHINISFIKLRFPILSNIIYITIIMALLYSATVTLILRNFYALYNRETRSPKILIAEIDKLSIPSNSYIITNIFHIYPEARRYNWRLQYIPSVPIPDELNYAEKIKLYQVSKNADYAIINPNLPFASTLINYLGNNNYMAITEILQHPSPNLYGPLKIYKSSHNR